jgi:hypothetical protein
LSLSRARNWCSVSEEGERNRARKVGVQYMERATFPVDDSVVVEGEEGWRSVSEEGESNNDEVLRFCGFHRSLAILSKRNFLLRARMVGVQYQKKERNFLLKVRKVGVQYLRKERATMTKSRDYVVSTEVSRFCQRGSSC